MVEHDLWLTWFGIALDAAGDCIGPAGDLNATRVLLKPSTWEPWRDGSGWFNRVGVPIPDVVMPRLTLLHGYRLHDSPTGGSPIWLPFPAPILFEEHLPVLPPGALQLRPGVSATVPAWKLFPAQRNPCPRYEHRQSLYTAADQYQLTTQVYFDESWRLLAVEILNTPLVAVSHRLPIPTRCQTTRMWVKFEH
jgi:hypothetical protein